MPFNRPSCSLCISTYNRPDALHVCLQSVLKQTVLPDEIIIGDDGSAADTKILIDDFAKQSPVPVVHVWQPDEGFRLAAIRNKSFTKASGDYIVQIDGDLILHADFIADHLKFAKQNNFVSGTRCLLTPEKTNQILADKEIAVPHLFSSQIQKKFNGIKLPILSRLLHALQQSKTNYRFVLGANMAFWKKDLIKVNGYNEAFTGWGKEDNELAVRLINSGVTCRFLKFSGIVYHLHHKEAERGNVQMNETMLLQSLHNNVTFAPEGLTKYL